MIQKEKISEYIYQHLPQYLSDLTALTAIDSGSDDLEGLSAASDWLEKRLIKSKARVQRYSHNQSGDHIVATWSGIGSGRILLLGHMDTVYARGTAAARPLKIEGDKIFAPGGEDMKGGLLLGIYAVEALQAMDYDQYHSISLLIVSDEEAGVRSSVPLIREQAAASDVIFCLEAARLNGDIVCGRKAIRWYTIEAFGKSAHAGVEPSKGCNAILALAERIPALHQLNHFVKGGTLNVGVIMGGQTPNVVPDYGKLRIDLRAYTENDLDNMVAAIQNILKQNTTDGIRFIMELEEGSVIPAMEKTPSVLALRDRALALAKDLGITMDAVTTGGASDASFAAALGKPVLDGLGPIGGAAHSPGEFILRSSIAERGCFLALLIAGST